MESFEIIINKYSRNLDSNLIDEPYKEIYGTCNLDNYDNKLNLIFAYYQYKINNLLLLLNNNFEKRKYYFLASDSRELLELITNILLLKKELSSTIYSFNIDEAYLKVLPKYLGFLKKTNGSNIPIDMECIKINEYAPIFSRVDSLEINLDNRIVELKTIGSGSYGRVESFEDPFLKIKLCKKTFLKTDNSDKDHIRFVNEYNIMRRLDSPYVVKAYCIDRNNNFYIMEWCDSTLGDYIDKNNTNILFEKRKIIALEFLNGLKYIYTNNLLHRDLSLNNILIKKYDDETILIKISDFGLAKDYNNSLTSNDSTIKGHYIDPCLDSFENYSFKNEEYSIGMILFYIFTGKRKIEEGNPAYILFCKKCISSTMSERFEDINEIILAVRNYIR